MPRVPRAYLDARRESIVDAARRAFYRRGTKSTTMAQVAAEAGLTPGALYRYFDNKDVLIEACFGKNASEVLGAWGGGAATGEPLEDLERVARKGFDQLESEDARIDTIIHLEHVLEVARAGAGADSHHAGLVAVLASQLRAARDAGQVSPETDPELLARALIAFYWGARLARLADPAIDTSGMLREMMRLLRPARREP